jgi:hypothetical protein
LGRTNILKQNSPMFPKYCPVSKYLWSPKNKQIHNWNCMSNKRIPYWNQCVDAQSNCTAQLIISLITTVKLQFHTYDRTT